MSENVENKTAKLEDLLKVMARANEVFAYEVFVPSLNKNVMFREMNTSQQKRVVKAVIDSPVYNTEFIFTLRQIMKENCVDPNIDIDSLTLIDKLFISLKMRAISIGNQVEWTFKCSKCDAELKRGIGLVDLIEKNKDHIPELGAPKFSDDKQVYTVYCSVPTIGTEYKLEDELRKNVKDIEIKDFAELRKTVGDAFIGELAKYINQIDVKQDEDSQVRIPLNDLTFRERIALIEKLPRKLTEKIVDYINKTTVAVEKITLFDFTCDKCGAIIREGLKIDSSFFTPS